jgi:hypothetical protein
MVFAYPPPFIPLQSPADRLHSRTFEIGAMNSIRILGTQEVRFGVNLGLEWGRPSRWLSFKGRPDFRVQEFLDVQVISTRHNSSELHGFAAAVGGRWIGGGHALRNAYFEAATGLIIGDGTTIDLDTTLNIMSFIGFGFFTSNREDAARIGLRWLHVSNADTNLPNTGQNLLQLSIGLRF